MQSPGSRPSTANVTAVWVERMMPRQASLGFGSSKRRNFCPDSDVRKTCRLSGELTRRSSLSCAAACDRAARYWRTALKISQVTHAPVPNTAKMASCCLSNGFFLSKSITPKEGRGKQQFYERGKTIGRANAIHSKHTAESTWMCDLSPVASHANDSSAAISASNCE